MEIQGADVSNMFYSFKASCNSWFYHLELFRWIPPIFKSILWWKRKKLLDAYWKLSLAIDATYKQVEDSGFNSK